MGEEARVGLVVAGAGARGAYEAGALSGLVPRMAEDGAPPDVLVGTSAGALNVVGLAGFAHEGWSRATRRLMDLWASVSLPRIVDVVPGVAGTAGRYLGQLAGLPIGLPSLFDTRVQRETLTELLPLEQMHANVASGAIDAVAVAATSTRTGGTVVFVEANSSVTTPEYDPARNIRYVRTTLTVDHVLASAAVPVAFRAIRIDADPAAAEERPPGHGDWFVDGGVRLNVPLKPALKLGCARLGVVATHPPSWPEEREQDGDSPDVFAVTSLALRALLSDRMVEDLHTLSRINGLVTGRPVRTTGGGPSEAREVPFLFAGPQPGEAGALGLLAGRALRESLASPVAAARRTDLWVLDRLIGGRDTDRGELLSLLLFEPSFTVPAAELGAEHAGRLVQAQAAGRADWPTAL